jgi:hypothetical protein
MMELNSNSNRTALESAWPIAVHFPDLKRCNCNSNRPPLQHIALKSKKKKAANLALVIGS